MYMYALSVCHISDVSFFELENSKAVTLFSDAATHNCRMQTLDRLPAFSQVLLLCQHASHVVGLLNLDRLVFSCTTRVCIF
jgi:hypothetical protein